ncbi:GTP-binding protein [Tulasnella sp. 331]|nr:GTP-binding protein [Tulasnella sp. 331]
MRWFDTLPPATVESWNQVRRAFLLRFDSPKPADAPVAAAAAAAPFPASIAATSAPRPHSISKPPLPAEVSNVYNGYALESAAVIILGDSGVGKSCWLQRHIGQGWAPWMIPTLGVQYEMFVGSYDGMKYKDCYWDTSGAEENQALIARYCQGISVAYLVYDVTNATSFWNIRTWHQMIKQHASQDIYLIGNKIDLKDKRVVQTQDGKRLAAELGVTLFYEAPAVAPASVPAAPARPLSMSPPNAPLPSEIGSEVKGSNVELTRSVRISNDGPGVTASPIMANQQFTSDIHSW